jgi:hypothetical protein
MGLEYEIVHLVTQIPLEINIINISKCLVMTTGDWPKTGIFILLVLPLEIFLFEGLGWVRLL